MEHLALEIFDLDSNNGSKYAHLDKDTSITISDTSEIFASGDVWTYQFTLNTRANAHIFGTSGEVHGARLHDQVNKRKARLWVDGLPLYMGYLKIDNEISVSENGDINVTFESGQKTFNDLIDGGKANQVPMMNDVRFGVAQWRKRWTHVGYEMMIKTVFRDGRRSYSTFLTCDLSDEEKQYGKKETVIDFVNDGEVNPSQQYPRMVFPKGSFKNIDSGEIETIDCINTDFPYDDAHPYCNVALCYQKQGYERYKDSNDKTETYNDYSGDPTPTRGYELMPANRVNSAPNFYVIYWIRSLMKHLGIVIDENQMMNVEDLRRLFFVNTKCDYIDPKYIRTGTPEYGIKRYTYKDGKSLIGETLYPLTIVKNGSLADIIKKTDTISNLNDSGFIVKSFTINESSIKHDIIDHFVVEVIKQSPHSEESIDQIKRMNSYLHDAIATSDCFPDADISEVIRTLENAFGVRLLFDKDYKRVRIVLLRNIFRNNEVQHVQCDIISDTKVENNIRGFRLTYGKTEDTHFYYKGFANAMPHKEELWRDTSDKHDYSHWDLSAEYKNVINKVSAFDKTCYVTPKTGNAYGFKVDKDAKRYEDLRPSTFEFAAFMDAEDGDCSGEKDTIHEISMGFTPAIMNDLNMKLERNGDYTQKFALFVNEKMRPRRPDLLDGKNYNDPEVIYDVDKYLYGPETPEAIKMMKHNGVVKPGEFSITSDMYATKSGLKAKFFFLFANGKGSPYLTLKDISIEGHANEGFRLYLQDNFEPNDDGVSPIETHDWGLTLGIMRSSGSEAYVGYKSDNDDEEGNDTWDIVPGNSATAHPDTCDCYGDMWNYRGSVKIEDSKTAKEYLKKLWPNTNVDLIYVSENKQRDKGTYILNATLSLVTTNTGKKTRLMHLRNEDVSDIFAERPSNYIKNFNGMSIEDMFAYDRGEQGRRLLIEANSSFERVMTMLDLEEMAFSGNEIKYPIFIDSNSIISTEGRISLKLRAEKPNPHFNPKQPESETNRRYLQITNPNLRNRGLADQFYKEYSYWVRNARICKRTVRMELSQLLAIDKTQRVTVGDITGFIRKMQYTVSNDRGLGLITMEIMYI